MQATSRELRPLGYGGILDETFELYRQNFILFAGIVAVIQIPLAFLEAAVMPSFTASLMSLFKNFPGSSAGPMPGPMPEAMPSGPAFPGLLWVVLLVTYLAGVFIPGAMTKAVSERYLAGPASIAGSYVYILRRFFSYLWTWIVVGLLILFGYMAGIFALAMLASFVAHGARNGAVAGIFLAPLGIVFAWFMIWFIIRSSTVGQVFVVESTWGFGALRRSWSLTKGQAWRTFVLFVLVYLLLLLITLGITSVAAIGIGMAMGTSPAGNYLSALVQGVLSSVTAPIPWIMLTLLYFDFRIRKEAFDLQVLAQSLGASIGEQAPSPGGEAMGFCRHCGAALPMEAQFCGNCGNPVEGGPPPAEAPETPSEPALSPPAEAPPSPSEQPERQVPKYRRVK